jgi:hypothetical protein
MMVTVGDDFTITDKACYREVEEELRNEPRLDNTKYHE